MAYLDTAAVVVLSPVPCVQVTVFDSVTDWGGIGFPPATPGVTRINADGSKEQVRLSSTTNAEGRSVWTDYECPQQQQVAYQAMTAPALTAPAVSDPVVMPDVGPWLINPANPSGSVPIMVQGNGFAGWTRASTVSVVPISGSAVPYVVESSVRQAPTGDLLLWVLGSDSHDALVAALATPGAKLFSWPRSLYPGYGQIDWAFVTTFADTAQDGYTSMSDSGLFGAQLTLQPSARPPVVPQSKDQTWDSLAGMTWDDLAGVTWDEL